MKSALPEPSQTVPCPRCGPDEFAPRPYSLPSQQPIPVTICRLCRGAGSVSRGVLAALDAARKAGGL
jgi:hypothetical protein